MKKRDLLLKLEREVLFSNSLAERIEKLEKENEDIKAAMNNLSLSCLAALDDIAARIPLASTEEPQEKQEKQEEQVLPKKQNELEESGELALVKEDAQNNVVEEPVSSTDNLQEEQVLSEVKETDTADTSKQEQLDNSVLLQQMLEIKQVESATNSIESEEMPPQKEVEDQEVVHSASQVDTLVSHDIVVDALTNPATALPSDEASNIAPLPEPEQESIDEVDVEEPQEVSEPNQENVPDNSKKIAFIQGVSEYLARDERITSSIANSLAIDTFATENEEEALLSYFGKKAVEVTADIVRARALLGIDEASDINAWVKRHVIEGLAQ